LAIAVQKQQRRPCPKPGGASVSGSTRIVISGRTSLQNVSRFAQEGRGNKD